MIDYRVIQNLSTKYQTTEINVIREYCQHLFLSYFYKDKPEIYFKGGTALRIVFGSSRFSEDLDFSSALTAPQIESYIEETLTQLEREGLEPEIVEAKETTGGYLSILGIKIFEHEISISFQISLRKTTSISSQVFVINNDYINDYSILTVTEDNLVKEKILACIDRSKPRDFYDVYFMLRAGMVKVDQRDLLLKVLEKLEQVKINFNSELKGFLPVSLHPVIKDFKHNLKMEITRACSSAG